MALETQRLSKPSLLSSIATSAHLFLSSPIMSSLHRASSCLDTLLYNIGDDGDSVLVPAPYWSSYIFHSIQSHPRSFARHYICPLLNTKFKRKEYILTQRSIGGFDHHFHFRSSVAVIPVYTSTSHLSPTTFQLQTGHLTESSSSSLIPALTRAYSSNQSPARIKALILTNSHNPL